MKQELIAGIVIGLIGLCLFLTPADTLWTLTEKWESKDGGEPSKSYAVLMRILGAVFTLTGTAMIVYGL